MPQAGIFDEVSVLEKRLLDAQRGQTNAEHNSKRLADLLTGEKRAHAEVSKDLGIARERIAALQIEASYVQGLRGQLSQAEGGKIAEAKRAAKFEKDLAALTTKYAKAVSERDEARSELRITQAENKRLEAEVEPVRSLAAAITVWHEAGQEMIAEAKKIRGDQ